MLNNSGVRCLQNLPFYRIFAADARSPRDGKHLENLGYYDPIPEKDGNKHVGLNIERIKYWLSVGAQPSRTVARMLGQAGVIPKGPTSLSSGAVKNPDKRNKTRVETEEAVSTDNE
jgi:small subunit ribosomal protein S16